MKYCVTCGNEHNENTSRCGDCYSKYMHTCKICGSKYEGNYNSGFCSDKCVDKYMEGR